MTQPKQTGDKSGLHLADMLTEDLFHTSDEEILAEFEESGGDVEQHAIKMRELFELALLRANKARLLEARAGAAAGRAARVVSLGDVRHARAKLRTILQREDLPLTLAARKENELSDSDVAGMLEDLRELGIDLEDEA